MDNLMMTLNKPNVTGGGGRLFEALHYKSECRGLIPDGVMEIFY